MDSNYRPPFTALIYLRWWIHVLRAGGRRTPDAYEATVRWQLYWLCEDQLTFAKSNVTCTDKAWNNMAHDPVYYTQLSSNIVWTCLSNNSHNKQRNSIRRHWNNHLSIFHFQMVKNLLSQKRKTTLKGKICSWSMLNELQLLRYRWPESHYAPTLSVNMRLYSPLGLCRFFSFLILYTVGRTPWAGDQSLAMPVPTHRTT
jgi:hypothetical protein